MTLPTNGITADVIRDIMPPYQLSSDLLGAMLAAIPPPPVGATIDWRRQRCARLVQELAGLMPANAPQARIAAEIVIVREAAEDTLVRAGVAGLALDQMGRLRRTASALLASVATLERSLVRHQQRPVPFFGTVLADGIDIAAIAAGWGGVRVRRDDREVFGAGGGAPADGAALVGLAGPGSAASAPPARWLDLVGQGLPATAMVERAEMATDAGSAAAVEPGSALVEEAGPNDAAVPGKAGIGEIVQGPYGTGDSAGAGVAGAAVNLDASCLDLGSLFAAQARAQKTCPLANSAAAVEPHDPPSPGQHAGATFGVVTRLDQGPGWTVDVVRPRNGG